MDYEQWNSLKAQMAVEAYCVDMADMMTARDDALIRLEQVKQSQRYMEMEHQMGQALIALERLGYRVEKENTPSDEAKDAARYHWLRETLMKSVGSGVEVNNEKLVYEEPEPGEEVRVYWYPDTPVGFYESHGKTLDEAIDAAMLRRAP